jgi:hypothetical protein
VTRAVIAAALLLTAVLGAAPLCAEEARVWKFLGGAASGLAIHEAGHVGLDLGFDAHPRVKKVDFSGIPFFAITHDAGLSARKEFAISSVGFWTQHATSEWILTRHPGLRTQRAPFAKGLLAFNVLTSVGYAGAAFGRAGPTERDTRGIATSLGVAEPWVGALILAPAALDSYRYYRPQARWAKWASRGAKVAFLFLLLK